MSIAWLQPCVRLSDPMGKRLFDIAASGAALLLLAPVLLAIALTVKIDSKGPVLFRQIRVGKNSRTFRIRKFRTMRAGEENRGLQITASDDPRITRAGAFLRKWKLDELPQFLDILAGDMSIVGPRPEVPRYVDYWAPDLRERILSVRPGLVDPASIAFLDEEALLAAADDPHRAYVDDILPAKVRLHAEYASTASMRNDLRIICRTLTALISRCRKLPDPA